MGRRGWVKYNAWGRTTCLPHLAKRAAPLAGRTATSCLFFGCGHFMPLHSKRPQTSTQITDGQRARAGVWIKRPALGLIRGPYQRSTLQVSGRIFLMRRSDNNNMHVIVSLTRDFFPGQRSSVSTAECNCRGNHVRGRGKRRPD